MAHSLIHLQRVLPRGRGDGTINNVGLPAATIQSDVRSLQQCCPQLFEVFGEDVAVAACEGQQHGWPIKIITKRLLSSKNELHTDVHVNTNTPHAVATMNQVFFKFQCVWDHSSVT